MKMNGIERVRGPLTWFTALLVVALTAGCGGGGGGQDSNSGNPVATDLPRVSGTIHANGATNVAVNTKVGATFSEGMDPSTINSTTVFLMQGATVVPGAVSYSGVSAVFAPASILAPRTLYTATVKGGAGGVKDLAGSAMASDFVWAWTTGTSADTIAPTISGTINANGAVNVAVNTKVGATFSEGMDSATLTAKTFFLMQGSTLVPGTVSYSGVSAVFTPLNSLAPGTLHTVTVKGGTGGVKALSMNLAEHIAGCEKCGETLLARCISASPGDGFLVREVHDPRLHPF